MFQIFYDKSRDCRFTIKIKQNMRTVAHLLIIFLISIFLGCDDTQVDENIAGDYSIITDDETPGNLESVPFELVSISLVDEIFEINVAYSGGCKEHEFALHYNGNSGSDSTIYITHSVDGEDFCEAYIHETILVPVADIYGADALDIEHFEFQNASNNDRVIDFSRSDIWAPQTVGCETELQLEEVICGAGVWDNKWFRSVFIPGDIPNRYFQPVVYSDPSLRLITEPEPGYYKIGFKILFGYELDAIVCEAYVGPSLPIEVLCFEEAN